MGIFLSVNQSVNQAILKAHFADLSIGSVQKDNLTLLIPRGKQINNLLEPQGGALITNLNPCCASNLVSYETILD